MIDLWRFCDADDDVVADFLAATVQGLVENGGWIHPDARLVARLGELHLECDADDGEPLVRVPTSAMLPVRRVTWADGHDSLAIADLGSWPDAADISLLFTQIGLHNSCGKLPRLVEAHPAAAVLTSEVSAAIRAFRPSFGAMPPADVLWATRTFRIPAFDDVAEPTCIPIVDFANHHPDGAQGQWRDGSFTIPVRHATGTTECFIDYGMQRDPLDFALVYGFADTTSTIAHSAAVRSAGVEVLDQGRSPQGELLPIDAQRIDGRWVLNRFTFGDSIDQLRAATGQTPGWCEQTVSILADANVQLLDRLDSALSAMPELPVRDVLSAASIRIRDILRPYC